jgi:hypothetical protein
MAPQRALDMALDLARMPAVASSMAASPLPHDVLDVIRIAAESPEACHAAASASGQPERVLIEAARFYVQQVLLRPEADSYRILGLHPGDSREKARAHMRWLLEWLHPDRNHGWDAIYAKRVVRAWREVAAGSAAASQRSEKPFGNKRNRRFALPLIKQPIQSAWAEKKSYLRFPAAAVLAAGVVTILWYWS